MKKPETVNALTELGRVQLSEHFFMRDMLYSEIANLHGMSNIPDLAIEAGSNLCQKVLEPIYEAFGGRTVPFSLMMDITFMRHDRSHDV